MRNTTTLTQRDRKVWTNKTTSPIFVPFHEGSAVEIAQIRLDYNLQEATDQLRIRRAVRYSNDGGASWTSPTEFGAAYSGDAGWSNDSGFTALDASYRRFQAGLVAKNHTGTALEVGTVDVLLGLARAQR